MTSNSAGEPRSRLRWLAGGGTLLAVPLLLIWWPGCRQYPAVTNKESLHLMEALYTACNTKDVKRPAAVEAGLAKLGRVGKLTPAEKAGFDGVVGKAKAGDWAAAEDAAFKFAEDQVGQSRPDPDGHKHPAKGAPGRGGPKGRRPAHGAAARTRSATANSQCRAAPLQYGEACPPGNSR